MRKIYLVIIILVTSRLIAASQSCLPDGIEFYSQQEIDSFQANYPGCLQIEGSVFIYGSDITNLNGLNTVISVGGDLYISYTSLASLAGLEALVSVGGRLIVEMNTVMASMTGLENLASARYLHIAFNPSLTSLSGIRNVNASAITDLHIYQNQSLSSCEVQSICNYLSNLSGSITIYANSEGCNSPVEVASSCGIKIPCLPHGNYCFYSQTDIDNFQTDYPDCTVLEGQVFICGDNITNLNGLISVTAIQGDVWLSGTDLLMDLEGLDNLARIDGRLQIENNDNLKSLQGLEGLTSVGKEMYIRFNNSLESLEGINHLNYIGGDLWILMNNVMTSLAGLEGLTSIGGSLYILGYDGPWEQCNVNNSFPLANLAGLVNVNSIGGDLNIRCNSDITSLDGLYGLVSVGGYIAIEDNINLTSITGLNHINTDSMLAIYINGNSSLSDCDIASICDYLASPNSNLVINDNASGCVNKGEVEAACGFGLDEKTNEKQFSIFPNPAYNQFNITFSLENQAQVNLELYDKLGKFVTLIIDESMSQGDHHVTVNAEGLPYGIYFCRFKAGSQSFNGKMVVVR